jgi:lipopolysaccharide transport system ATP-binding protein
MTRKEVAQKFDEIVDFSGVERFIDTPVKRYSSGMTVRLAFAVAAHLDPEILIVDEVLAVGDEAFQEKCLGKMEDVTKQGRTLLFVSHNMASVNNLCKRTIVMEEGSVAFDGPTSEAVAHYLRHIAHADEDSKQNPVEFAHDPKLPFQIRSVGIFGPGGQPMLRLPYHDDFELRLTVEVVEPNHNYYTGFSLHDGVGNCIAVCTDEDTQVAPVAKLGPGLHCYRVPISGRWLKPGSYTVTVFGECWFAPLHHRHEGILEFHIVDLASRRASKNMYRKQAVVAPEIEWTIASDECPT